MGNPLGLSDEEYKNIQDAIKFFYTFEFIKLDQRIKGETSAFKQRELSEFVDSIIPFNSIGNISFCLKFLKGIDWMTDSKPLTGFINSQIKKYWESRQFDSRYIQNLPSINYDEIYRRFRESFTLTPQQLEDLDIFESVYVNMDDSDIDSAIEKTIKYPRLIDFDDQFKDFFENNKELFINFSDQVIILDPTWHYEQLLKPLVIEGIEKYREELNKYIIMRKGY